MNTGKLGSLPVLLEALVCPFALPFGSRVNGLELFVPEIEVEAAF
jgi:hypothetical protein